MSGLKRAIERAGVKPEDLEKASSYQRRAGGAIEQVLVNMGSLSEDQLPFLYADALNEPLFDDDVVENWQPSSLGYEPDHIEFFTDRGWLPLYKNEAGTRVFCTHAPLDREVAEFIRAQQVGFKRVICSRDIFDRLHAQYQASVLEVGSNQ